VGDADHRLRVGPGLATECVDTRDAGDRRRGAIAVFYAVIIGIALFSAMGSRVREFET